MSHNFLDKTIEYIKSLVNDQMSFELDKYQQPIIIVQANAIHQIISELKGHLGYTYLNDLTGAHYPLNEGNEFQVVYHVHNLPENVRLRIKVNLPKENPSIPSISDIFSGANWMERETFDFFGIEFTSHPNLTRILNMDNMDYHPMRKEYALEDETRKDKNDTFFGR
jgi:NADH-quinone oxidoreductase subunit C